MEEAEEALKLMERESESINVCYNKMVGKKGT